MGKIRKFLHDAFGWHDKEYIVDKKYFRAIGKCRVCPNKTYHAILWMGEPKRRAK
jgi:hypothetical protein